MSHVVDDVAAVAIFLAADTADVLAADTADVLSTAKAASGGALFCLWGVDLNRIYTRKNMRSISADLGSILGRR